LSAVSNCQGARPEVSRASSAKGQHRSAGGSAGTAPSVGMSETPGVIRAEATSSHSGPDALRLPRPKLGFFSRIKASLLALDELTPRTPPPSARTRTTPGRGVPTRRKERQKLDEAHGLA